MTESASLGELECVAARERIRRGGLRGEELLGWLAERVPAERERAIERLLDVDECPPEPGPLGADLVGYFPSGVAQIVRAVFEAPVTREDLFVDLGAGLGKVAMLAHLLSGARARGVELQGELVARARARADRLGLTEVSFVAADARNAVLDDGSVFFLYVPFTGAVLDTVLQRLRDVASKRDIVVCALGFDLPSSEWLRPRTTDAFWLTIYDGGGGRPRGALRRPSPLSPDAEAVAFERGRIRTTVLA